MKTGLLTLLLIFPIIALVLIPQIAKPSNLPPESHPCILYQEDMIDTIRDRLEREPYSRWWAQTQNMLSWIININFSTATELQKARYSKMLAFGYVMTDSLPYAEKALEGLSMIDPDGNWGGASNYHAHADPLTFYCETYDMLKGAGYPFAGSENYIRSAIAEKAQEFMNNFWIVMLYQNNWRIRYFAGLGNAAFTLADHSSAESWHDYAENKVREVFSDLQYAGEGAWAEGPYYQMYSARIYMPYLITFQRLITTADMLNEVPVQAVHDWNWKIRMPDSRRPNFEDSHLHYFFSDFFAPVSDANPEIFQWDFQNVPHPDSMDAENYWIPDAICYYDDTLPAVVPDLEPTICLPEAGNMIFRSGWDTDDIYLFLIGEHGDARVKGYGHDHPDATSFLLSAYGEYLALDAGYINWDDRVSVNKPRNHSLILVDGQGPAQPSSSAAGDADAYLKNFYDLGLLQFCSDSTYYRNTHFNRGVLFVDRELFVLRDRLDASSAHTYNWRLHGNGGETSGGEFELTGSQAVWSRENASLYAAVAADVPLTCSATPDTHSFSYNQILTHSTLDAECVAQDLEFLSVLHPVPAGAPAPVIEELTVFNGMAFKLDHGVAAVKPDGQAFTIPESQTGFPSFTAQADFIYCGFENEALTKFALHPGQSLSCNGNECFNSDSPVNFALVKTGLNWQAYVSGTGEFTIDLYIGSPDLPEITFNGEPAEFTYQNGTAVIDLAGQGILEITISLQPPENVLISVIGDLPVLTWDNVLGASGYNLYRSENPYFTPSEIDLAAAVAENTWTDPEPVSTGHFYIVTAVSE